MTFFITTLLAILGLIATDIFVPSLPSIGHQFHLPLNYTQLTVSLFLIGFSVSQLFYGPISDRTGRKGPLLFGAMLFTCGSLVCAFAPSFVILCLGRILQGLAVGSGLSLARVILRDCYSGAQLSVRTAQLGIFVSITPAAAPFIGGLLQEFFGFRAVFLFLVCYGALLLYLLTFHFKETLKVPEKELNLRLICRHYKQLLTNFHFMHYVLISGIAFSAIILYVNIVPFIVQDEMHLSAQTNGNILLFSALGVALGCYITSRMVRSYPARKLLGIGLSLLILTGILLITTRYFFGLSLFALVPLIFLATLSCGLVFPNALALAFSQINVNIGVAGAIYGCSQISFSTIINFVLNAIPNQGQILLGTFYCVLGICGIGLLNAYRQE